MISHYYDKLSLLWGKMSLQWDVSRDESHDVSNFFCEKLRFSFIMTWDVEKLTESHF